MPVCKVTISFKSLVQIWKSKLININYKYLQIKQTGTGNGACLEKMINSVQYLRVAANF